MANVYLKRPLAFYMGEKCRCSLGNDLTRKSHSEVLAIKKNYMNNTRKRMPKIRLEIKLSSLLKGI